MIVRSPARVLLSVVLLFSLFSAVLPAAGKERQEADDDIDRISLAGLLIRDGHYDRAAAVLSKVDEAREDIDLARLYTLRGLVGLHQQDLSRAKSAFRRAIDEGQTNLIVHVYLAQVYYGLQEYQAVLDAIDAAGAQGESLPELYLMRAQSHWELDEPQSAWRALDDGQRQFPENRAFLRRKVFFLIELGLYQEAAALGREYLQVASASEQDHLAIANALRRSGQPREAAAFLEMAQMQDGASQDITLELAHAYLDLDWKHAAAGVLEQAVGEYPTLASEAAELYRRTGRLHRALLLNTQIQDQQKKLKQRLALLLEMERYQQAATMADALRRVGLLQDEDIRYALAYAYFRSGDFEQAEAHLARLSRPALFRKAAEIRKAMDECRDAEWKCY